MLIFPVSGARAQYTVIPFDTSSNANPITSAEACNAYFEIGHALIERREAVKTGTNSYPIDTLVTEMTVRLPDYEKTVTNMVAGTNQTQTFDAITQAIVQVRNFEFTNVVVTYLEDTNYMPWVADENLRTNFLISSQHLLDFDTKLERLIPHYVDTSLDISNYLAIGVSTQYVWNTNTLHWDDDFTNFPGQLPSWLPANVCRHIISNTAQEVVEEGVTNLVETDLFYFGVDDVITAVVTQNVAGYEVEDFNTEIVNDAVITQRQKWINGGVIEFPKPSWTQDITLVHYHYTDIGHRSRLSVYPNKLTVAGFGQDDVADDVNGVYEYKTHEDVECATVFNITNIFSYVVYEQTNASPYKIYLRNPLAGFFEGIAQNYNVYEYIIHNATPGTGGSFFFCDIDRTGVTYRSLSSSYNPQNFVTFGKNPSEDDDDFYPVGSVTPGTGIVREVAWVAKDRENVHHMNLFVNTSPTGRYTTYFGPGRISQAKNFYAPSSYVEPEYYTKLGALATNDTNGWSTVLPFNTSFGGLYFRPDDGTNGNIFFPAIPEDEHEEIDITGNISESNAVKMSNKWVDFVQDNMLNAQGIFFLGVYAGQFRLEGLRQYALPGTEDIKVNDAMHLGDRVIVRSLMQAPSYKNIGAAREVGNFGFIGFEPVYFNPNTDQAYSHRTPDFFNARKMVLDELKMTASSIHLVNTQSNYAWGVETGESFDECEFTTSRTSGIRECSAKIRNNCNSLISTHPAGATSVNWSVSYETNTPFSSQGGDAFVNFSRISRWGRVFRASDGGTQNCEGFEANFVVQEVFGRTSSDSIGVVGFSENMSGKVHVYYKPNAVDRGMSQDEEIICDDTTNTVNGLISQYGEYWSGSGTTHFIHYDTLEYDPVFSNYLIGSETYKIGTTTNGSGTNITTNTGVIVNAQVTTNYFGSTPFPAYTNLHFPGPFQSPFIGYGCGSFDFQSYIAHWGYGIGLGFSNSVPVNPGGPEDCLYLVEEFACEYIAGQVPSPDYLGATEWDFIYKPEE